MALDFPAPAHHPAPELLVDYVSGAHSAAEALLIELHLVFCAGCRRSVRVLLAAGGEMLDGLPAERLPPNLFNRTLQMLDRTRMPSVAALAGCSVNSGFRQDLAAPAGPSDRTERAQGLAADAGRVPRVCESRFPIPPAAYRW